jgi:hypothetical protein
MSEGAPDKHLLFYHYRKRPRPSKSRKPKRPDTHLLFYHQRKRQPPTFKSRKTLQLFPSS